MRLGAGALDSTSVPARRSWEESVSPEAVAVLNAAERHKAPVATGRQRPGTCCSGNSAEVHRRYIFAAGRVRAVPS